MDWFELLKVMTVILFGVSDAFDTELLISCMEKLKSGETVSLPDYDFKTHNRTGKTTQVFC